MSFQELESRIAKLAADISTQKEVLRQLENSKSAAERQLNAIRDPVARLPLEIAAEIFLQCLPARRTPTAHAVPLLLLNICNNTWTDLALSTPALWATIDLHGSPSVDSLHLWLQRARHYPLSISLNQSLNGDVAAVLGKYSERLKHLELYDREHAIGSFPSLPGLETLTIGSFSGGPNHLDLECIIRLLRLAPNIVRCTFVDIEILTPRTHILDDHLEILILPNLRSLEFTDAERWTGGVPLFVGSHDILNRLSLPALDTLVIPLSKISLDSFPRFLERSAPPLRKLVLNRGSSQTRAGELLRLMPFLTDFELDVKDANVETTLLAAFADSDPLLPNLRSLKIRCRSVTDNELLHETVLRVITARRSQLACFHFAARQPRPTPEVCEKLRLLAASDGIEILIGDEIGCYYFKENCTSNATAAEESDDSMDSDFEGGGDSDDSTSSESEFDSTSEDDSDG